VILRTTQLILRPFTADDGPGLHSYLCQERAVHYEPYGVQDEQAAVRLAAQRAQDDSYWAVCLESGGDLIGNLYLAASGPEQWRTWELGYVFNPDRWGQGYATQACRGLLDHVFQNLWGHRVLAECSPENIRSWALLERLGFRREGHVRAGASFASGADGEPVWHDSYLYAVLDTEWESRTRILPTGRLPRDGDQLGVCSSSSVACESGSGALSTTR